MTIRRTPTDFVVQERLGAGFAESLRPERSPERPFAVYRLTKEGLTTPDAAALLARGLGAHAERACFAGLKDRHALTTQHVSVDGLEGGAARELGGRGWSAALAGWSAEPMRSGAIEGNRFAIVVRGLAKETCREMDRRAALLDAGAEAPALLVMNYFGSQRFGSARHGQGWVARRLLEGDFEGALRLAIATPARQDAGRTRAFTRLASRAWGDWKKLARELPPCPERRAVQALARGASFVDAFGALPPYLQALFVEAHQSMLWNEAARRLAWVICAEADAPLRSDDLFGELVFPRAGAVGPAWRDASMPLPAPGAKAEGAIGRALDAALEAEGLAPAQLRIPGVRRPFYARGERPLFIGAGSFTMGAPEADDSDARAGRLKRSLAFELPRGAYATVVLRALGQ